MSSWTYQVVLAAEPASPSYARDFVCRHLTEHSLRHLLDDVRLVVSELATNAVVHAQTPFTVELQENSQGVTLSVGDGSRSVPHAGREVALAPNGRGLMIVDLVSRDWGISTAPDGSKKVWANFATDAAHPR